MTDGNEVNILKINDVLPNRFQPRIKFNEDKINELSDSIRKYGVIQPIIVRKIGTKYEIIAGERRFKASVMAGLKEIPALINNLSDEDSSEVALIENVQRENLTPTEEAISYRRILDMGYMTQESLAKKLGISQSAVANKLRLLNLTEEVQEALLENKISERHARSLLKLKSHLDQEDMLKELIKNRYTVRQLDKRIEEFLINKNEVEIPSILRKNKEKINETVKVPVVEIPTGNVEETEKDNSNDIEILDIVNNINKGAIKVNNDNINMFQVPSVNIENEDGFPPIKPISPVEPLPSVEPLNPVQPLGINPGFMDIDRIEKEATDINIVNPNLKGMNIPNQVQTPVQHGKFFDMGQSQPVTSEVNNDFNNFNQPMPSVFDSPTIIPVEPMKQPEPVQPVSNSFEMPTIEQVLPINNGTSEIDMPVVDNLIKDSNPFNPGPDAFEIPVAQPVTPVQEVTPLQPEPISFEMPVAQPVTPVQEVTPLQPEPISFEMPVAQPVTAVQEVTPLQPEPISFEMPVAQPVAPVQEVTPLQPEPISFEMPVAQSVTPVQEVTPLQPEPVSFEMPTMNTVIPQINPISFETPVQPIPVEVPTAPSQISEPVVTQQVTIPTPVQTPAISPELVSALGEVRQLFKKLESQGIKIEMDEMDLPYSYAITLKINK